MAESDFALFIEISLGQKAQSLFKPKTFQAES
jgi:hypothetical protein